MWASNSRLPGSFIILKPKLLTIFAHTYNVQWGNLPHEVRCLSRNVWKLHNETKERNAGETCDCATEVKVKPQMRSWKVWYAQSLCLKSDFSTFYWLHSKLNEWGRGWQTWLTVLKHTGLLFSETQIVISWQSFHDLSSRSQERKLYCQHVVRWLVGR